LSKAIWGYLSDKFTITASELSMEKVSEILSDIQTSQEIKAQINNLLNEIEYARFSPSGSSEKTKELYEQSIQLIIDIEKAIKK